MQHGSHGGGGSSRFGGTGGEADRRQAELLRLKVPDDEVRVTNVGKFACLVCPQWPVLDTAQMLVVHRAGKKHAAQAAKRQRKEAQRRRRRTGSTRGRPAEPRSQAAKRREPSLGDGDDRAETGRRQRRRLAVGAAPAVSAPQAAAEVASAVRALPQASGWDVGPAHGDGAAAAGHVKEGDGDGSRGSAPPVPEARAAEARSGGEGGTAAGQEGGARRGEVPADPREAAGIGARGRGREAAAGGVVACAADAEDSDDEALVVRDA